MSNPHTTMTLKHVKTVLKAAGPIDEDAQKALVCSLVGHSRIVDFCFGYVTCARCGQQLGDTLAGAYDLADKVINGHACVTCVGNSKTLTWRDKFMAPDPFPGVSDG